MMTAITDTNFDELVLKSDVPVLVDFWAPWCGPCRMITPIVEELAAEYEGKYLIAIWNVDDCSEVPLKYGIRNIPTILFFKGGELKDKLVGMTDKAAIVEKLNTL
ncbi:MAG: thioredoxin [Bacteroidales bacterium]|nr:thioredoxin [Bacteroidales bacterium]